MNKFELVKLAVSTVTTGCVGMIIKEAVQKITPDNMSMIKKIGIAVGGAIITDYASSKIITYVDDQVTYFKNFIDLMKACNFDTEVVEIEPVEINKDETSSEEKAKED